MATSTITQTISSNPDIELKTVKSHSKNVSELSSGGPDLENVDANDTPPTDATPALESWNLPIENKYRVLSAFWSFIVIGMNDGSYGVSHLVDNILSYERRLTLR